MASLGSEIDLLVIPEASAGGSGPGPGASSPMAFAGLPIPNHCAIAIQTDGSPRALMAAEELSAALFRMLRAVARPAKVPAQWTSPAALLYMPPTWNKLLLLISEGKRLFPDTSLAKLLLPSPTATVLPVLPRIKDVPKIVGPDLAHLNVRFWDGPIVSVVADVLALSGLTTLDRRVFISYRRADALPLADQLFDALSRANFDVFLDRVSVDPGVNFQQQLTEKLASMSMVLLLETKNIMKSTWTLFEIDFVRQHKLGLFALQLPGGKRVPNLAPDQRKVLKAEDFTSLTRPRRLQKTVLNELIQEVEDAHGAAWIRRRQYLRKAMSVALSSCGARKQSFGKDGLLTVTTNRGQYRMQLTTRPPVLDDFSLAGGNLPSGTSGLVIAPAEKMSTSTVTSLNWLSGVCSIPYFDEGRILDVARTVCGPPVASKGRGAVRPGRKR